MALRHIPPSLPPLHPVPLQARVLYLGLTGGLYPHTPFLDHIVPRFE